VDLGSSLAVLMGGCIAEYAAKQLIVKPLVTLEEAGTDILGGIISGIPIIGDILGGLFGGATGSGDPVTDQRTHVKVTTDTVSQCLVRTLGRLAVQNITDSLVNWINSGFDGKPAFVQDFDQFFADTADQAAGQFIQGSDFAFLCSPFKLQVRIAIAQSYARRSNAPSCTLTGVVKNIDQFANGDFGQGGWQGLISFTTEPSNNPFGAYMALSARLDATINNQQINKERELAQGNGFLSVRKCDPATPLAPGQIDIRPQAQQGNCRIVTPGYAVVSSFNATTQATLDSLQMGDSINQILAALQNALITKMISGADGLLGAGNTDQPSDQPSVDPAAQAQATALMKTLRTSTGFAQVYGTIKTRIISDIQTTQVNLNDLRNCWINATSSPTITAEQSAQAVTEVAGAVTRIQQLQLQVNKNNNAIRTANMSITRLQQLQTELLIASVAADVKAVQSKYDAVIAAGNLHMFTAADITTAQQDRATTQSQMDTINAQATASLTQCNAINPL
jgi:hypothetical protein